MELRHAPLVRSFPCRRRSFDVERHRILQVFEEGRRIVWLFAVVLLVLVISLPEHEQVERPQSQEVRQRSFRRATVEEVRLGVPEIAEDGRRPCALVSAHRRICKLLQVVADAVEFVSELPDELLVDESLGDPADIVAHLIDQARAVAPELSDEELRPAADLGNEADEAEGGFAERIGAAEHRLAERPRIDDRGHRLEDEAEVRTSVPDVLHQRRAGVLGAVFDTEKFRAVVRADVVAAVARRKERELLVQRVVVAAPLADGHIVALRLGEDVHALAVVPGHEVVIVPLPVDLELLAGIASGPIHLHDRQPLVRQFVFCADRLTAVLRNDSIELSWNRFKRHADASSLVAACGIG